ncbi:carboxylate--amine ligase [Hyphococcus sp.]|uniref:carboxylate--amine ligase n=1 Tax=Hyphococcus sp. TaxID=2038636 RepID=UPI0035C6D68F
MGKIPSADAYGRVIVTYGRSLMSLVAAQSLAKHGLDVIGCDSVDMTALHFSRYCRTYFTHPAPEDDEDAYIAYMCDMLERHRPDNGKPYILMPLFDNARILARRKSELPDFVTLAAPDTASIGCVYPKDNLVRTMKDFPEIAPDSAVISSMDELRSAADKLEFPLVLKPAEGVGGRGVSFVDNLAELEDAASSLGPTQDKPLILQETAPGEDFCMTALADNGEIRAAMAYRNLETFPQKSGAGTVRETVDHAPFMEATQKILAAAKWNGVAEIDFRWDGDPNTPAQLIEVNARFWAGLYHSMASGVDYPWLLYQLAAYGEISESRAPEIGKITKTPVLSTLSAITATLSRTFRFPLAKRIMGHGWRELKAGNWREGAVSIWRGLGAAVAFDRAAFTALEKFDETRSASGEFDHAHDPYAGLGVLFIVSSLMRHGRLPDEVKY